MQETGLNVQLSELKKRMEDIRDMGFVESLRKGPTGIGYTLETLLGLTESNLPIPDVGGRVELKAARLQRSNLITLFTFNRGVWSANQRDVIELHGNEDANGRIGLYSTVVASDSNSKGFQLAAPDEADCLQLRHVPSGVTLATWDMYYLVGKFVTKFERLLFAQAESRKTGRGEEFEFRRARLLTEPGTAQFRHGFVGDVVKLDVRMHLKPDGSVRNHGTGFRVHEHDLPILFGKSVELL